MMFLLEYKRQCHHCDSDIDSIVGGQRGKSDEVKRSYYSINKNLMQWYSREKGGALKGISQRSPSTRNATTSNFIVVLGFFSSVLPL